MNKRKSSSHKSNRRKNGIKRKNAKTRRMRGGVYKWLSSVLTETKQPTQPTQHTRPTLPTQHQIYQDEKFIEHGNNKEGFYTGHAYRDDAGNFIRADTAGVMAYTQGPRYMGSFVDGKIYGKGTYIKDDKQWVGEWQTTAKGPASRGIVERTTFKKDGTVEWALLSSVTFYQPEKSTPAAAAAAATVTQGTLKYTYLDNTGRFDYAGDMVKGIPHGTGTCVYYKKINEIDTLMNIFKGKFKNGFRDGKGTDTNANGDTIEGEWKNGILNGRAILTVIDDHDASKISKKTIKGEWINNSMDSRKPYEHILEINEKMAYKYEGTDEYGTATEYDTDGKVKGIYTGNWSNSKRNGFGTLVYADGRTITGMWKDDQVLGLEQGYAIEGSNGAPLEPSLDKKPTSPSKSPSKSPTSPSKSLSKIPEIPKIAPPPSRKK